MRDASRRIGLLACLAALTLLGAACHGDSARKVSGSGAAAGDLSPDGGDLGPATRPSTRLAQIPIVYSPRVARLSEQEEAQLRRVARESEPPGEPTWFIYVYGGGKRADVFYAPVESTPRLRKGHLRPAWDGGEASDYRRHFGWFEVNEQSPLEDYTAVSPSAAEPFGHWLGVPDASVLSLPLNTWVLSLAPAISDDDVIEIVDLVRAHRAAVPDLADSPLFVGAGLDGNVTIMFGDEDHVGWEMSFRREEGRYVYGGCGGWAL